MRVSARVDDPVAIDARVAPRASVLHVGLIRVSTIVPILTIRSVMRITRRVTRNDVSAAQRISDHSACCIRLQLELRNGLCSLGISRVARDLRVVHVAS